MLPQKKGDPVVFDHDEFINLKTNADALAGMRPAFDKAGGVAAGNASGINDGAAAVMVMSAAKAQALGSNTIRAVSPLSPLPALDPATVGMGPVPATRKALERAGWKASDVDLYSNRTKRLPHKHVLSIKLRTSTQARQRERRRQCHWSPDWRVRLPRSGHPAA
jgi:acetyl-CoA C-acetyltransferase